MSVWVWVFSDGCLSLGGDKKVRFGEYIPTGALTPERLQELEARGWAEQEPEPEPESAPKKKRRRSKKNVER